MIAALLVGLVLGYVGSIPAAGPLALLIVASGLERDRRRGVSLAVGGATAEGLYALLAFWGMSEVLPRYPLLLPVARGVGAVLLVLVGAALVRHKGEWREGESAAASPQKWRHGAALLGFSLVALNPAFLITWAGFAALVASVFPLSPGPLLAPAVALGAFLGIVGWFATLLALVHRHSVRVSPRTVIMLLRCTGVLLILMGGWLGVDAICYLRSRSP
jgi:threonine/homoserine/homoserine lactone efflux protein